MLRGEIADHHFIKAAFTRDSRNLVVGGRRTDVWVEAAAGGGNKIDWNSRSVVGIGGFERINSGLHRLQKSFIRGS